MGESDWFAGIDAGGTATKSWLYRQRVGLIGRGIGPPGNLFVAGADGVADAIWQSLQEAAQAAGVKKVPPIKSLAACIAGARGAQEQAVAKDAIARKLINVTELPTKTASDTTITVYPDAAAGLVAGTLGAPGVVVIAGTGSTVWALSAEGEWQRAGGWGYLLGDEGSGFSIGLDALKAVVKSADGLEEPTALVQAFMEEWQLLQLSQLLPIVYAHPVPRDRIASLAPVVTRWAKKGDNVASRIVHNNVVHLVKLAAVGVDMAALDGGTPVIVVGGVFKDANVLARFTAEIEQVRPRAQVIRPRIDPAAGACILALQAVGVWTSHEQETLLQSYSSSPI